MTQSEGKEVAVPSAAHRAREAQTTALADFASRWWAVALALVTVIGAYFQLREEIATVRAEARETRNELQRLRFWLENPEKFPGRNAEGEPLESNRSARKGDPGFVNMGRQHGSGLKIAGPIQAQPAPSASE